MSDCAYEVYQEVIVKTRMSKLKRRLVQILVQVSERFSKLPVAVVLVSLWVTGAMLIGLCVTALHLLGLSLQRVSGM